MVYPKISVIIPIYNVENYLEDTLDSLLNQTFIDNLEVLMIDDGSTDNSRYIVEKYALDYDNFYAFHKKNEGQCVARNFGLIIARGEYIHFMDADDFIVPDAYEKLYGIAKKEDYDVVTFNHLRYDKDNTWKTASAIDVFDEFSGNVENTSLYDYKELSWDMPNCNKIIKKKLLDEHNIKFYYRNIIYEDNLFMIDVYSKAKNVAVLKDFIYFWRYREDGTSTTQKVDINLGKRFYEMVYLVNNFLIQNISDKVLLNKKYEKLLTINLYFLMKSLMNYPREDLEYIFESIYEMVDLVPDEFFQNLNSYFQVVYWMIKNKDLDNLNKFLSYDFKSNPSLPSDISEFYVDKLNFIDDSYLEDLNSSARNVFINDNNLVIKFDNFVPFNFKENFEKISFELLNNQFDDILLNSEFIGNNLLTIPLSLINFGENKIITKYYYNGVEKENFMNTNVREIFCLNGFDITIKPGKASHLQIFKRAKNGIDLTIEDISFKDNKFHLKGNSNEKLESVMINDSIDVSNFEYPINYHSKGEFDIVIPYSDFLKAPIKKWEISSNHKFNKINLSEKFEFCDEKYLISFKNNGNKILAEFNLYNSKELINQLTQNYTKLNDFMEIMIKVNNRFDTILSETFNPDVCIKYDLGFSENYNDIWNVSQNGNLIRTNDYSELVDEHGDFFIEMLIPSSNLLIEYDVFQVDGVLNDYHVQLRRKDNGYVNGFSIKEMDLPLGTWHHIIVVMGVDEFIVLNSTNLNRISRSFNVDDENMIFQFKTDGDNTRLRYKNFKIYGM